jgi:cytochrome c oxidase subunit 2
VIARWLGMPVAAAAGAARLDLTMGLVHALMLVLFLGWGGFFVYTLVRFRAGRNPKADYAGARSRVSTWVEIGVAVAEGLLLVGLSIPAWASRVSGLPPEHEAVLVRVVAEQFAWNIHYPGPDGVFGATRAELVSPVNPIGLDRASAGAADDVVTVNQMHLPVNRPVIVQLTTKDVIHSFSVPNFRVKQDAIPGLMVPVWFVPDRPGRYDLVCAQLCGLGHYRMRGTVTVETETAFDAWIRSREPAEASQTATRHSP